MQTVEFTTEELAVLRDLLERATHDIDIEVLRTDTHDYKEMLKRRRNLLENILSRVSSVRMAA